MVQKKQTKTIKEQPNTVGKKMKCRKCNKEYINEYEYENLDKDFLKFAYRIEAILKKNSLCDDCDREENQKLKSIRVKTNWSTVCPKLYRDTDPSRLDEGILKIVNNWKYGALGIGIVGDSGIGKTRAIFWRLRREHEDGRSIHYRCATQFADKIGSLDKRNHEKDECVKADILFIDDIDKIKFTERVETDLFDILESRSKKQKPFIFTSNSNSFELGRKLSNSHSKAILRRLSEFCEVMGDSVHYEYAR